MQILSKKELNKELDKIITTGSNDITIDIEDAKILNNKELIVMSMSEDNGLNSSTKAMQFILNDLKLSKVQINKADSFLLCFEIHPDYEMINISNSMETIFEMTDENTDIIFGTSSDSNKELDSVKITFFAGFESI